MLKDLILGLNSTQAAVARLFDFCVSFARQKRNTLDPTIDNVVVKTPCTKKSMMSAEVLPILCYQLPISCLCSLIPCFYPIRDQERVSRIANESSTSTRQRLNMGRACRPVIQTYAQPSIRLSPLHLDRPVQAVRPLPFPTLHLRPSRPTACSSLHRDFIALPALHSSCL